MKTKLSIETHVKRLVIWLQDIEHGIIQTPEFQRDFVWSRTSIKDLFDSIKNGYPIGSVLLWKPKEESFERNNNFGPYYINESSNTYSYILDGFQRMSTLFGCLTNPNKINIECDEAYRSKKFNLYYDLKEEEFIYPRSNNLIEPFQVPVYNLINTKAAFSFQNELYLANVSDEDIDLYLERYSDIGTAFIDYSLPSINIDGGNIQEAVEIFSRVNSKGTPISTDWMISALAYDHKENFRLGSLIDDLIDDFRLYNFDKLTNARNIILQCITNSFGKFYLDQKIETLISRKDFIDITKKTLKSILKAVEFLYCELYVVNSKLLPYGPQLIYITDFFNHFTSPTNKQKKDLKNWFWITTYSNYFTMYPISKQRKAYNQFKKFLQLESTNPVYIDNPKTPFQTAEFPQKIFAGSVRSNALTLFLLNYSNDFKTISNNEIEGYYSIPLFSETKDSKGNYFPSSIVPKLIIGNKKNIKQKDCSYLLKKLNKDLNYLFITKQMQKEYKHANHEKVIELRYNEITIKEKLFVEQLNITYA